MNANENKDGYNGWTNYETWAVALWLDNDEGSHEYWNENAQDALDTVEGDKEQAAADLAEGIKGWVTEMAPDLGASMFADLLNAAISEVNWYEIAEGYLADKTYEKEEE